MKNKIIPLLSVVSLVVGTPSLADDCSSKKSDLSQMKPPNLVVEPDYTISKQKKKRIDDRSLLPPQKLQYEPTDSEPVVLEEREGAKERKAGAEYMKGMELFITPQPSYVVKDEEIQDPPEQPSSETGGSIQIASPCSKP